MLWVPTSSPSSSSLLSSLFSSLLGNIIWSFAGYLLLNQYIWECWSVPFCRAVRYDRNRCCKRYNDVCFRLTGGQGRQKNTASIRIRWDVGVCNYLDNCIPVAGMKYFLCRWNFSGCSVTYECDTYLPCPLVLIPSTADVTCESNGIHVNEWWVQWLLLSHTLFP